MTSSIRTVVVDDDFRVASVHAAYVEKVDGFEVVGQAHSAAQATAVVAESQPDLVLMDVFLPDGDGLDVVRTLMGQSGHPDVIVITAARDVATVRHAMQLGAIHYLVKPFGFAALSAQLSAYRRLRQRLAGLPEQAEQSDVDELFGMLRHPGGEFSRPDKGFSGPTLDLVVHAVRAAPAAVSASEVAERIGISRATAQRYLQYLQRRNLVHLQLCYGATGRPEHRYAPQ